MFDFQQNGQYKQNRVSALGIEKFQNKSKNIDEVYPSEFFHCIIFYHAEALFFVMFCGKFIIHQKVRYDIFYKKVVKWCYIVYVKDNKIQGYGLVFNQVFGR